VIVQAVSFGSLWLTGRHNPRTVWNTTAVTVNGILRSRAQTYGLVRLSAPEAQRLSAHSGRGATRWICSDVSVHNGARTIHLQRPASKSAHPDRYLVAVSTGLVGKLSPDSWDADTTQLLSFSQCASEQEVLLLLPAFGWVRGSAGSAVLTPSGAWKIAG
jgi:hypothetical protein